MGKIIGESFNPYVADQIKIRQEKLGAKNLDPNVLAYTTNKTSWLRLSSGVNVDNSKLSELSISNQGLAGNKLAESYILFGGVSNANNNFMLKGGFPDSYTNTLTQNTSYGFNSNSNYGLTPLPGIESAGIVPKNRGSLREANIVIKAFNREQFNIIETLYMRLKYSILLEWGHTMYFTNGGTLVTNPIDTVYKEFLKTTPITLQQGQLFNEEIGPSANLETFSTGNIDANANQNKILNLIKNQRKKSNGNYDGFLGWVTNFSWDLSPEGVYTINLKTISYGDIIESLSITKPAILNLPFKNEKKEEEGSPLEILLKKFKDLLVKENYLEKYHNKVEGFSSNKTIWGIDVITNGTFINGLRLNESFIEELIGFQGNFFQPGESSNFIANKELLYFNTRWIAFDNNNSDQFYIKLGSLLRIIQNFFLIYDYSNPKNPPLSFIDYNYNETFCSISQNLITADPKICLIPSNISFKQKIIKAGISTSEAAGFRYSTDIEDVNLKNFNTEIGTDFLTSDPYKAKPLHIHVNINFIITQLNNNLDENGDLSLYDFLTNILKGINSALAGITDLGIYYDEETNTYSIIDNNPPIKPFTESSPPVPTKINVKGLQTNFGSFAKSFAIKSEISNKFSTQIAIGAQANNTSLGSDSVAFSNWNLGLTDRIITKKSYSTNPLTTNSTPDSSPEDFATVIKYVASLNTQSDLGRLESLKSNVVNYLKIERDIEVKNGKLLSKSFIPISLNLELDGISGIKLFQKYTINDEILPQNYRNNIEFLTKGLRHSIDQSGWTTSIEGLSIPKQK